MVNFFAKVFARLNISSHFMELESLQNQYAGSRIADIIRSRFVENTKAVIVLLGENLENPPSSTPQYTHNWVNFEVGVAVGCKKPIWVFEESDKSIKFPIPYVTDFCKFDIEKNEHIQQIGDILDQLYHYDNVVQPENRFKCRHCNAEFNFWSQEISEINCPVCRETLHI